MTAPAPVDERLRAVVDVHTGETVFGPATRAQISDWIIRTGFWMGADLTVRIMPASSDAR